MNAIHSYCFGRVLRVKQIRERSGESPDAEVLDYGSRATIAVIGGKWKTAIISTLKAEDLRFGVLRRCIPKASRKVLTEQLRQLQRDGVILRVATGVRSQCVEYSLTDHGRTLISVLTAMAEWGEAHLRAAKTDHQPVRLRHESQGA